MKTKNFLLFSTCVFAISIFLIVFHSQPPQTIQSIVSQTHQHIKDFQASVSVQEKLRHVEEKHLVEWAQYTRLLGLDGAERWRNTTTPALVTYVRHDHAMAVDFVRDAQRLPYTVLLYNIGLKPAALAIVANYCNSSKCAIIDFDLEPFPSHVSDESIHAVRPLIIQPRRLPLRADGGGHAPRGGRARRRPHAALGALRAHARLHHAHRRAVGRVPVRQEAAVPVLGVPRAGRVGAEHHPRAALRVRGVAVRGARRRRGRVAPRARGGGARAPARAGAERHGCRRAHRRRRRAAHRARAPARPLNVRDELTLRRVWCDDLGRSKQLSIFECRPFGIISSIYLKSASSGTILCM